MERILHIALSCFYVEGLSYQENLLPKYHAILGYDTWILTSVFPNSHLGNPLFLNSNEYINNYNVHVVKLKRKKKTLFGKDISFNSFFGVFDALTRINPDIIFIHGLSSSANQEIARYLKRNKHIKVFADQHGDFFNAPYKTIKQKMEIKIIWIPRIRAIQKYVDTFFGTTPWRCDYLNKVYKIPKNKIELLVMGVDSIAYNSILKAHNRSEIRKKYGFSEKDFVICTGGKINLYKNIHILVDAFNRVTLKNVKLLIFGSVDDKIKKMFFDLIATNSNIKYRGWASNSEILEYFAISDFAIFPGTHSVLWEQACGCGVPCAFNNWDGMKHVDLGGNCLFVDGGSIECLLSLIIKIVSNDVFYTQMLEKAKKVADAFSYITIAKKAIHLEENN